MQVKIKSEKELHEFAARAWHILVNIRYWENKARAAMYTKGREQLQRWQGEADKFIKSMAPINGHDLSKTDIIKEESK